MDIDMIKCALVFLDPRVIRRLLGRSVTGQKARALVMHDRALTGWPRG